MLKKLLKEFLKNLIDISILIMEIVVLQLRFSDKTNFVCVLDCNLTNQLTSNLN
ncbi:hypothetical protein SAMN05443549_10478 [Flavobacterium fluvii]|uniref:Uncharacterized protein n=1 Tax=Flavobacterium fluvii TaxID=468056 RepID=A0A1M5JVS6_9FLAO|nr:hypothetical protein SAMN05443549_10478 [Flavobacterium fluvii]